MKKYKNYIVLIIGILLMLTVSVSVKYLNKSKYEELPEVKLKEKIEKNKSFAIMVQNENGNDYVKYTEDIWPSSGYKFKEAKCTDNNGNMVENAITFDSETKTVTLETDKTVVCTLYFDVLFNGKGSKDNPYKINFIEDLVDLQVAVNNGESYAGKYFTLEKSLDFNIESDYQNYQSEEYGDINGVSGVEGIKDELTNQDGRGFIPIGSYTKPFSGNIDGKNNKISNLWIYNTKDENQAIGFVGNLNNGSISNLTISGEVKTTGTTPLGGLVNVIENSTIDNCTSEVNVTSNKGNYAVGGLVGWSSGDATIKNSTNRGNVTNGGYTGGIIAGNQGGTLTIENCKNYGAIENNLNNRLGGLVGDTIDNAKKTIIKNSVNYGEIKANNTQNIEIYAGGIMGRNTKELEIINSHNEGVIDINGINKLEIGGIIGSSQNILNISNSYNLGEIKSTTSGNFISNIAGILGEIKYSAQSKISKIENSYNKGNINGGNRAGGIVGRVAGISKIIINKCYNSGNIITQEDTNFQHSASVGGVACQSYNGAKVYIINSYNTGILKTNPKKTAGYASGIILEINNDGSNGSSAIIINSYNLGNINAKSFLASFGQTFTDNDYLLLNNVYNVGNLDGGVKNTVLSTHNTNSPFNVKNTYYKEVNGIQESDKGDISEAYPITEDNMKNANVQDSNSLIYKLNQNVVNINKSGLSSLDKDTIGTDLDGYTLVDWVIDPITGYPTLNYNLENS